MIVGGAENRTPMLDKSMYNSWQNQHLPIQETKLPFKMAELLFNKYKGDRVRVLMGEGHMVRQCTQPKRLRNSAWFKEKMLLVQAQESGQVLDEEQLAFLADLGVADGQAS
nr:retrovirus-related Pol polyprotein from transposon TNT 1-94 [Tanacetum cinerariifolium]